ncbi:MAG TPA: cytochrome c [Chitinophagales bacterium]|nr:cytochrome c [Chitinophagales bacterium]
MNKQQLIKLFTRFGIFVIIAIFIYDIYSHGSIEHPGKAGYKAECSECHGDNGEGIKTLVPPLHNAAFARAHLDSIPCWIKFGMNHPITVGDTLYDQPMYPNKMSDVQAANIINYLCSDFWQIDTQVNAQWVTNHWKNCQ